MLRLLPEEISDILLMILNADACCVERGVASNERAAIGLLGVALVVTELASVTSSDELRSHLSWNFEIWRAWRMNTAYATGI